MQQAVIRSGNRLPLSILDSHPFQSTLQTTILGGYSRDDNLKYSMGSSSLLAYEKPENLDECSMADFNQRIILRKKPFCSLEEGMNGFVCKRPKPEDARLEGFLFGLKNLEETSGKAPNVDIISQRGILVSLAMFPFQRESVEINLCKMDNYIYMSDNDYREDILDSSSLAGYKFESVVTGKDCHNNYSHYISMTKDEFESDMKVSVAISSEIDCFDGKHIELKTRVLKERRDLFNEFFRLKLMKTYYQCVLASVEKVKYGLKDGKHNLRSILNLDTDEIPGVANCDPEKGIRWLNIVLWWVKSLLKHDGCYRMVFKDGCLVISKVEDAVRKRMIPKSYIDWRKESSILEKMGEMKVGGQPKVG